MGEGREEERERNVNVWLPLAQPLLGTWPTPCLLYTSDAADDPRVV